MFKEAHLFSWPTETLIIQRSKPPNGRSIYKKKKNMNNQIVFAMVEHANGERSLFRITGEYQPMKLLDALRDWGVDFLDGDHCTLIPSSYIIDLTVSEESGSLIKYSRTT